ncbi:MAG TPA: CinA family protein, partial [Candidatus Dormibacteraeota bacterium]
WRLRRLIRPAPAGASPADPLAVELGGLLGRNHMTIAVAESCTGGLLGSLITDVPGSSAYFLGGAIAYADDVKRNELEVPASLLTKHGAVSREVAIAMAEGARSRFSSAFGVSITCIAGPDADGSDKPVGLTYIAIASARGTRCDEHVLHGDRWSNRREAAAQALRSLIEEVATAPQASERKPA